MPWEGSAAVTKYIHTQLVTHIVCTVIVFGVRCDPDGDSSRSAQSYT